MPYFMYLVWFNLSLIQTLFRLYLIQAHVNAGDEADMSNLEKPNEAHNKASSEPDGTNEKTANAKAGDLISGNTMFRNVP